MQNNKSQTPEDDIIDNDLDLGDMEEADLADDSWDEFDEEASGKSGESQSSAGLIRPKKKSSSGKTLVLLIVIAAACGGAYVFLNKNSAQFAGTETRADGTQSTGIVELADESAPPMPAPIDSAAEPSDISESSSITETTQTADSLTPLPGSEDLAKIELDDLNAPAAELAPAAEENPQDSAFPLKAEESAPTPAVPQAASPLEPAPVESVTGADTIPVEVAPENFADTPAPAATDLAVTADIEKLQNDLNSLRSDLEEKLDQSNEKVAALTTAVEALRSQLEDNARTAAARQEKQPEKTATQAIEPKAEKPAPVPAPILQDEPKSAKSIEKSQETPSSAPVKSTEWQLRSAQPGKAMLSPKGSGEMKSVSVGDTVNGLGRITSINIENGVWTVRGTKGFVSR